MCTIDFKDTTCHLDYVDIDYAEIAAGSPDFSFEKVQALREKLIDPFTFENALLDIGSSMHHEMVGFDEAVEHVIALDKEVNE